MAGKLSSLHRLLSGKVAINRGPGSFIGERIGKRYTSQTSIVNGKWIKKGAEYHGLCRTVEAFHIMGRFQRILLGSPLMATQSDMERTVTAILNTIPKKSIM